MIEESEMSQSNLQSAENSPQPVTTGRSSRLFYIDHLRAALVTLVVLHHLAIVYGEGISFWYVDPPKGESSTVLPSRFLP